MPSEKEKPAPIQTEDDGRPKLHPQQVRMKKELREEILEDLRSELAPLKEFVECANCLPDFKKAREEMRLRKQLRGEKV